MANMASVAYAIEGPKEDLKKIRNAICQAMDSNNICWTEWVACLKLGYAESQLTDKRLGGEISQKPVIKNKVLKVFAEERWGLQDFAECLEVLLPEITVYWVVEEPGMEVFCTNDKEGKYFPEKYWVDTAQNDIYQSEYFITEEAMYKWLNEKYGVQSKEEVEAWNSRHEEEGTDCENFINIYEFEIAE